MACEYCDIINGKKRGAKIYDDGNVVAFLSGTPATIGHLVVVPKEHRPIMEAMTDDMVSQLLTVANKTSIALFEAVKCEGTNILINNGIEAGQEEPHFSLNILARKAGDGLSFDWAPKHLTEEGMASVELQLKEELEKQEKAPEQQKPAESKEDKAEKESQGRKEEAEREENYLIKQLRRMP